MAYRKRMDNADMSREKKHRVPSAASNPGPNSRLSKPTSKYRIAKPTKTSSKLKRPPGRPFKMALPSANTLPVLSSKTPQPVSTPATRRLSLLESLPKEILEQIFLRSLNLNLPRASPIIAAALSREKIYQILIILAFWDDDTELPSSEPIRRALWPLDYVGISLEDRGTLQQDIFRTRWCTMERVRQQIPTIMILIIHRQWINFGIRMEPDQQAALERFLRRREDTVLEFYGEGPSIENISHPHQQLRLSPSPVSHKYRLSIKPMVRVEIHTEACMKYVYPALSIIEFPDFLLRGRNTGFTPEDVLYLEMLRLCSNNYAESETGNVTKSWHNRVALHEGVDKAIRTQNYNAMICLLKLDEFLCRYHVGRVRECYLFPEGHFNTVAQVGRDRPHLGVAFLEGLVRASAESLPVRSPEIVQWAHDLLRMAQVESTAYNLTNALWAKWVSDFMLRLPDHKILTARFPHHQLFKCGQVNPSDAEGLRFINQVLGRRPPLRNWMIESEFIVDGRWVKRQ